MWQASVRRRARFEDFVDVVDLDGKAQSLPATSCEVEEHHAYVALRFGSDEQRVVRIARQRFSELIAARQLVYLSW
ncbi:MAG: hypothetical protein WCJ87_07330 [Burkholderiales bacterium]